MDNSKEMYLQWLINQIGINTDYHNHKETMAWVATASYITGVIALGLYLPRAINCLGVLGHTTLLLVLTFLALYFVYNQLKLRQLAADEELALKKLVNNLCKNHDFVLTDAEITYGKYWPVFIEKEINNNKGKGRQAFAIWGSDVVIYVAIGFSAIVAFVLTFT